MHICGLRADTDRWAHNVSTGRGCLFCQSLGWVENEQHLIFDSPAYNHIRAKHVDLFQHCCTVADFMPLCESNACGGFLRDYFASRKEILSV